MADQKRPLFTVLISPIFCIMAIWVLDVLVNIKILRKIVSFHNLIARPLDFFGLFLSEIPISICLFIFCLIAAGIFNYCLRKRGFLREYICFLSSSLCALAVFVTLLFVYAIPHSRVLIITVVAFFFFIPALRMLLNIHVKNLSPLYTIVYYSLYPPIIIGYANAALGFFVRGNNEYRILAVQAVAFVCIGIIILRSGHSLFGALLRLFPVLVSLVLVTWLCILSTNYGTYHEKPGEKSKANLPNIILIVMDTVRADHLKCYGYWRDTMPSLEEWAKKGIVVKRAISSAGWTKPAHASIFSGRTVSTHGVHYASGNDAFVTMPFDGIAWLPELLSKKGYYCLAVSANPFAMMDKDIGFDRIFIPITNYKAFKSTFGTLFENIYPFFSRLSEYTRWRMPYADAEQIADMVMQAVPSKNKPFFLFVNFLDAHSPYNPPECALEDFKRPASHVFSRYLDHRKLTVLWESLSEGKTAYINYLYDGELRWIDMQIARLFEWIERRFGENTLIIITSDHGEELGEAGRVGHEYGLSQNILHVPLFIRYKGSGHRNIDSIVELRRLYHFIADCGSDKMPDIKILTRRDQYGIVSERYPSGFNKQFLGDEYYRPWISMILGKLKVIGPSAFGAEVFNVDNMDFQEKLVEVNSEQKNSLCVKLDHYWEAYQDKRGSAEKSKKVDNDELGKLKSLGYVQ